MGGFAPINRVPNLLFNQSLLSGINRTNAELFRVSQQLATGQDLLRPSDDSARASLVSEIDSRIERGNQRLRNLDLASSSLATADAALSEVADLLRSAHSLALEQAGVTSNASERQQQATVVQSLLDGLLRAANRESVVGSVFGGTTPGQPPVVQFGDNYQFVGGTGSLTTDTSNVGGLPVTIAASNVVAGTSGRVQGSVDLQPQLTADTRIVDLRGATGGGVTLGRLQIQVGTGVPFDVDLTGSDTVGDVIDKLTFEIRQYEIANSVTVLGPGGISFSGTNLTVDAPNAGAEVRFLDIQGSSTARDLGLRFVPAADFDAVTQNGDAVNPRLTAATPISALAALTTPLDSIRLGLNAQSFDIDLSTATTIGDVAVAIEGAAEGLRVEIDSDTNGINVFNELSGTAQRALTITDVPSTNNSATALGIRSLNTATQISDFNFGDGVTVLSGNPDPTFNVDFEIVLPPVDTAPPGTPSTTIPIDLSPADMATVGTLLAAVNTQIDAALTTAGRPTTDLTAGLATGTSGLALIQDATITTPSSVDRRNNSTAADQLGFLNSTFDSTSNSLIAEDRSAVRVDSVFTHLLDLKEALETNDTLGIEVAARRLEVAIDDVTEQRAVIGGFDRRAQNEIRRAEDNAVVDAEVRSQIADLDFAEAAARFSQLQTQLEAGLRVTSLGSSLSLLDFLG